MKACKTHLRATSMVFDEILKGFISKKHQNDTI